jgi:hypothetical protein
MGANSLLRNILEIGIGLLFLIGAARLFTVLLVVFQLIVAFCILSRGELVVPGLIAGAIFCFAAALVSNTGGAIANLILAVGQLFLALTC